MNMLDLVKYYQDKLEKNPNDYSCLLFALQLPSICSRIEFPQTSENTGPADEGKFYRANSKVHDANMYKAWVKKHKTSFRDIYGTSMTINEFCDNLYTLRCQMTHEGVLMSDKNKFYFIDGDNVMCLGEIVFLPMKRLCENMFNAAHVTLHNHQDKTNVTLFSEMLLPNDVYKNISEDIENTYHSFLEKHSKEDNLLICIYYHIIFDNPDMKNKIDNFFNNNPYDVFEIWDYGYNYGPVVKKFDKNVLCLTKQQYERMLQVVKELDDYSKQYPFDITKYIKE